MSSWYPKPAAPREVWRDLRGLFASGERYKLAFAAIAVGITSLIVTAFVLESRSGILPGRSVIYAADWSSKRSDAEIVAQQKIDQKIRHAAIAERRRQFQKLDDAMTKSGL